MSLWPLFEWWGRTPVHDIMNGWEWAFVIVEVLHMAGFVLLIGSAAIIDFRLLGWRLNRMPVWELSESLAGYATAGLIMVLLTGPLIVSTDVHRYYVSFAYRFKMTCLLLALLFDVAVHRRVRARGSKAGSGMRHLTGAVSLILWSCVVVGGRFIGVFD